MWIRSQDRLRLVNANAIYINACNHKEILASIAGSDGGTDDFRMGTYAAEERAMQVLDEIQQNVCTARAEEITAYFSRTDHGVFNMPEA